MEETKKKQVATFRFGVIADLVGGMELQPGDQERLLGEKTARKWVIPYSEKTRISRSTILRWVKEYKEPPVRLESLYPRDRSDQGKSRVFSEETGLVLMAQRREFPRLGIGQLIEQMTQRGIIDPGVPLHRSTVYRFLHQQGLMKLNSSGPEDRRKFEAEQPNDLWQSDVMHGPMVEDQGRKKKTYLIAFIDDHSRLVPHGCFYLSETINTFLKALEQALLTRGLPRKLYVDNGPAFRSHHLEQVTASLGIALIHARPYKPQGKGKIERFFRTVRMNFLSGFQGKTLADLNEAFAFWLRDLYHHRKHGATGQAPFVRFTSRLECLRLAPSSLRDHFRKAVRRKVAKDRTLSLKGKIFEAPIPLIGKQVTVLYHEEQPDRVEVILGQQSYGFLAPVDIRVNCRVKRDKNNDLEIASPSSQTYRGGSLWDRGNRL